MDVDGFSKDCGEAFGRLFDHRPALRSEISYFLREFEEKRGNREQLRLQKSLEFAREINEQLIPSIDRHLSANLTQLNLLLNATTYSCQKLLEPAMQQESRDWLESRRAERAAQWAAYVEKMCERCKTVDDEFAGEIKRVEDYYVDLEAKLNLNSSPSSSS